MQTQELGIRPKTTSASWWWFLFIHFKKIISVDPKNNGCSLVLMGAYKPPSIYHTAVFEISLDCSSGNNEFGSGVPACTPRLDHYNLFINFMYLLYPQGGPKAGYLICLSSILSSQGSLDWGCVTGTRSPGNQGCQWVFCFTIYGRAFARKNC